MAEAAVADAPVVDAPAATPAPEAPAAVDWAPNPKLASLAAEPPASTDPPAAEAAPNADPTPEAGADAPSAADVADWKAKLDAGDADILKELLTHPKLAGHIGTLAQRQAQALADKVATDAREAELDRAAQEDPDNPLAQERLKQRQTEMQQLQDVQARLGAFTAAQEGVAAFVGSLPDEARAEIAKLAPEGKPYGEPGDLNGALKGYMADVVAGAVAAEVAKAKAAWEKDTLPGLRKEIQAEMLAKEPAPDLGVGARTTDGAGGLTAEKYAQMSPAELRKLTSTPAGRAQIDKMWASPSAA